ncbi:hypothetical protein U1Q18_048389 [Sarracenia purpurea var. burkii]
MVELIGLAWLGLLGGLAWATLGGGLAWANAVGYCLKELELQIDTTKADNDAFQSTIKTSSSETGMYIKGIDGVVGGVTVAAARWLGVVWVAWV